MPNLLPLLEAYSLIIIFSPSFSSSQAIVHVDAVGTQQQLSSFPF